MAHFWKTMKTVNTNALLYLGNSSNGLLLTLERPTYYVDDVAQQISSPSSSKNRFVRPLQ